MNQMTFETFTWTWAICAGILSLFGLAFLGFRFFMLRALHRLDKTASESVTITLESKMETIS